MTYAWLVDNEKALEYYERANDLGWTGTTHTFGYAFILIQTGQFEKTKDLAMAAVQIAGTSSSWVDPVFSAMLDQGNASKVQTAIDALDVSAAEQQLNPLVGLTVRTILGDLDGAMRIARLLEEPGEAFEMDMLFIPELKALRAHPDFLPLLDRLGITEYWMSKGCVWGGDRVSCP